MFGLGTVLPWPLPLAWLVLLPLLWPRVWFVRAMSSLVFLLSRRGRRGDGGGECVKALRDSFGPRLEGLDDRRNVALRCWGDGLRVLRPERDPSVLARPGRMTELRQEMMRSEGVLWDDSLPIEEVMLRRPEFERRRMRREMVEFASQFSKRRLW